MARRPEADAPLSTPALSVDGRLVAPGSATAASCLPGLSYWALCTQGVSKLPPKRPAVVVPCFNEERVGSTKTPAFRRFASLHGDVRFLFVNDGSTDRTPEIL